MSTNDFSWPNRRPAGDPLHDLITSYLVLDVQSSPKGTAELLEKIQDIKTGRISAWERIGNAYTLTLHTETAEIFDEYTEETDVVPLDDLHQAALAWQQFIKQAD